NDTPRRVLNLKNGKLYVRNTLYISTDRRITLFIQLALSLSFVQMEGLESFEEGELPPSPKAQSHHISKNRRPNIQAWQSLNNILQKTNLIKPAPTKLTQNANYAVTIGKSTKPKHISPVKPPTRPSGRSYSPVRLSTGDDYTDMLKNFKKVREHQRSRSTEDEKIRRRKYRDHPRNRHFSCTDYKETIDLTLSDSEPMEIKRPFQEKMSAKDNTRRQLYNVPDKKVFKWVNGELKRTAENKHTGVSKHSGENKPTGENKHTGDSKHTGENKPTGENKHTGDSKHTGENKSRDRNRHSSENRSTGRSKSGGGNKPSDANTVPDPKVYESTRLSQSTAAKKLSGANSEAISVGERRKDFVSLVTEYKSSGANKTGAKKHISESKSRVAIKSADAKKVTGANSMPISTDKQRDFAGLFNENTSTDSADKPTGANKPTSANKITGADSGENQKYFPNLFTEHAKCSRVGSKPVIKTPLWVTKDFGFVSGGLLQPTHTGDSKLKDNEGKNQLNTLLKCKWKLEPLTKSDPSPNSNGAKSDDNVRYTKKKKGNTKKDALASNIITVSKCHNPNCKNRYVWHNQGVQYKHDGAPCCRLTASEHAVLYKSPQDYRSNLPNVRSKLLSTKFKTINRKSKKNNKKQTTQNQKSKQQSTKRTTANQKSNQKQTTASSKNKRKRERRRERKKKKLNTVFAASTPTETLEFNSSHILKPDTHLKNNNIDVNFKPSSEINNKNPPLSTITSEPSILSKLTHPSFKPSLATPKVKSKQVKPYTDSPTIIWRKTPYIKDTHRLISSTPAAETPIYKDQSKTGYLPRYCHRIEPILEEDEDEVMKNLDFDESKGNETVLHVLDDKDEKVTDVKDDVSEVPAEDEIDDTDDTFNELMNTIIEINTHNSEASQENKPKTPASEKKPNKLTSAKKPSTIIKNDDNQRSIEIDQSLLKTEGNSTNIDIIDITDDVPSKYLVLDETGEVDDDHSLFISPEVKRAAAKPTNEKTSIALNTETPTLYDLTLNEIDATLSRGSLSTINVPSIIDMTRLENESILEPPIIGSQASAPFLSFTSSSPAKCRELYMPFDDSLSKASNQALTKNNPSHVEVNLMDIDSKTNVEDESVLEAPIIASQVSVPLHSFTSSTPAKSGYLYKPFDESLLKEANNIPNLEESKYETQGNGRFKGINVSRHSWPEDRNKHEMSAFLPSTHINDDKSDTPKHKEKKLTENTGGRAETCEKTLNAGDKTITANSVHMEDFVVVDEYVNEDTEAEQTSDKDKIDVDATVNDSIHPVTQYNDFPSEQDQIVLDEYVAPESDDELQKKNTSKIKNEPTSKDKDTPTMTNIKKEKSMNIKEEQEKIDDHQHASNDQAQSKFKNTSFTSKISNVPTRHSPSCRNVYFSKYQGTQYKQQGGAPCCQGAVIAAKQRSVKKEPVTIKKEIKTERNEAIASSIKKKKDTIKQEKNTAIKQEKTSTVKLEKVGDESLTVKTESSQVEIDSAATHVKIEQNNSQITVSESSVMVLDVPLDPEPEVITIEDDDTFIETDYIVLDGHISEKENVTDDDIVIDDDSEFVWDLDDSLTVIYPEVNSTKFMNNLSKKVKLETYGEVKLEIDNKVKLEIDNKGDRAINLQQKPTNDNQNLIDVVNKLKREDDNAGNEKLKASEPRNNIKQDCVRIIVEDEEIISLDNEPGITNNDKVDGIQASKITSAPSLGNSLQDSMASTNTTSMSSGINQNLKVSHNPIASHSLKVSHNPKPNHSLKFSHSLKTTKASYSLKASYNTKPSHNLKANHNQKASCNLKASHNPKASHNLNASHNPKANHNLKASHNPKASCNMKASYSLKPSQSLITIHNLKARCNPKTNRNMKASHSLEASHSLIIIQTLKVRHN
ncbi:unnamed protein product, partial [Owenia fusiformis]